MALGAPQSTSESVSKSTATGMVLPDARSTEMVAFESEMVSFFVDAAELLGVPKSVAAIYGIVFASPEPLSFSEIEARLTISKGSVSQGMRVLRDVGAIKEVSCPDLEGQHSEFQTPNSHQSSGALQAKGYPPLVRRSLGERGTPKSTRTSKGRDRFEPDMELRKLIKHFLESRLQSQLESSRGRLQQLEAKIPAANAEQAKRLRDRTKYLSSWNKKARALMPIAKTFLKLS